MTLGDIVAALRALAVPEPELYALELVAHEARREALETLIKP